MLMTKGIKEIVISSGLIYVNIDYRVFEFRIFVCQVQSRCLIFMYGRLVFMYVRIKFVFSGHWL